MTPKEKARKLLEKVDECVCGDINEHNAKDMAVIICQEVIDVLDEMGHGYSGIINGSWGQEEWRETIKEIQNTDVRFKV